MIFEKLLMPDLMAANFAEVTPGICRSLGVCALICDIDNTLVTYDDAEMTGDVESWIASLGDAGINVAFVSNNSAERMRGFIGDRDLTGFPKARKPSPKYFKKAANLLCAGTDRAAVLGDQLLTDSLAAHLAGMKAIIVPPIKDKTSALFRVKRKLEIPYIMKYLEHNPHDGIKNTVWHK